MTNDCLVTKLKGTVNNDMLTRFGYHGIKVNMTIEGDFNNPFINPTATSDVIIRGNAYFKDDSGANLGKTGKATFQYIHAEAGIFYLEWKDGSLSGNVWEFFCKDKNISANTETLSYIFTPITRFYNFMLRGNGDISKLLEKIEVENVFQLYGYDLVGDIINVIPASIVTLNNSGITGTLESLLQKFASSIEKTIKFEIVENPGITYQGVEAYFYHRVSFDGAGNYTILD